MRLFILLSMTLATLYAQSPQRFLKIYNVQFLTKTITDHPGEELWHFESNDDRVGIQIGDIEDSTPILTVAELTGAIKNNIYSDSWKHPDNNISYLQGKIIVTQTSQVHKQISSYLKYLTAKKSRLMATRFTILSIESKTWNQIARKLKGPVLDAQTQKQIFALPLKTAKIIASTSVMGLAGQTVNTAKIKKLNYIQDYDVEIATNSSIADPIVGKLKEGFAITVQATPCNVKEMVRLRIFCQLAKAERPIKVFNSKTDLNGNLQLPETFCTQIATTVITTNKKLVLVGAVPYDSGRTLILLAQPRIISSKTSDKAKTGEKRELNIYDVSLLTNIPQDFPAPDISQRPEYSYGGAVFEEAVTPEGLHISIDNLKSMIQQNIEEDSWHNERNSITIKGNNLAIVQTPKVLKKIGKFISDLILQRSRTITVHAHLLLVNKKWVSLLEDQKPHISKKTLVQLDQEIAKEKDVKLLARNTITCLNSQQVNTFHLRRKAYIKDYDVEVAQGAKMADPVISDTISGICMEIKPHIFAEQVLLELQLHNSKANHNKSLFVTDAKKLGSLHTPYHTKKQIKSTVIVGNNKTIALGFIKEAKEDRYYIVLLEANINQP